MQIAVVAILIAMWATFTSHTMSTAQKCIMQFILIAAFAAIAGN